MRARLAALGLALAACTGGGGPLPCEADLDCPGGSVCAGEVCREVCGAEDLCLGPDVVCDEAVGLCVGCLVDRDCGGGEVCEASACVAVRRCEWDLDCRGGERCARGVCAAID